MAGPGFDPDETQEKKTDIPISHMEIFAEDATKIFIEAKKIFPKMESLWMTIIRPPDEVGGVEILAPITPHGKNGKICEANTKRAKAALWDLTWGHPFSFMASKIMALIEEDMAIAFITEYGVVYGDAEAFQDSETITQTRAVLKKPNSTHESMDIAAHGHKILDPFRAIYPFLEISLIDNRDIVI